MTNRDSKAFTAGMRALCAAFGQEAGPETIQTYYLVLKELTIGQVETAIGAAIQKAHSHQWRQMPSVTDLLELGGKARSPTDAHHCAWTTGARHCLLPANITENGRRWLCAYHYACQGLGFAAAHEDFAEWIAQQRQDYATPPEHWTISNWWERYTIATLWAWAEGRQVEPELEPTPAIPGPETWTFPGAGRFRQLMAEHGSRRFASSVIGKPMPQPEPILDYEPAGVDLYD